MPFVRVNDVDLFTTDEHHTGEAVVLVHGSWDDHTAWNGVAPLLCERFRVVRYDRRGYGRTERPAGPRLRRQDEDDLAGLIEELGCAPAHVVGNSIGGSTALVQSDHPRAPADRGGVGAAAATAAARRGPGDDWLGGRAAPRR